MPEISLVMMLHMERNGIMYVYNTFCFLVAGCGQRQACSPSQGIFMTYVYTALYILAVI